MALNSAAISAAIKALSISGMKTIRDVDGIPESVDGRSLPIMFPDPTSWMEAGQGAPEEETTFGTPTTRMWTVHRSFNYIWLYDVLGSGRGLKSYYVGGSTMLDAIVTALIALDVSAVDVEGVSHTRLGVISDAAESKQFVGAFITVKIRERIQA